MPVQWTISHPTRLVVAVAKGDVGLVDIEAYLDGVTIAGALPYRKIFDASDTTSSLSDSDLMALGARIRAYKLVERLGAIAIVAATDRTYQQAKLFEALAAADRPLKIFRELHLARRWLDAIDPASPA